MRTYFFKILMFFVVAMLKSDLFASGQVIDDAVQGLLGLSSSPVYLKESDSKKEALESIIERMIRFYNARLAEQKRESAEQERESAEQKRKIAELKREYEGFQVRVLAKVNELIDFGNEQALDICELAKRNEELLQEVDRSRRAQQVFEQDVIDYSKGINYKLTRTANFLKEKSHLFLKKSTSSSSAAAPIEQRQSTSSYQEKITSSASAAARPGSPECTILSKRPYSPGPCDQAPKMQRSWSTNSLSSCGDWADLVKDPSDCN